MVKSSEEIFAEQEKETQKRVIEIRRKGRKAYYLNLNELNEIVGNNFTIIRSIHMESPKYLVEDPGTALAESFETLITDSSQLLQGLTPKVARIAKNSNHLLIQYAFIEPAGLVNNRRSILLVLATFLSIFLSGIVNSTNINNSQGIAKSGWVISGVDVSFDAFIWAFMFSSTLILILLLKDVIQILIGRKYYGIKMQSYFIPAPPIFELGTIGSFVGNLSIHRSRSSMFYTSLIGPLISWVVSVIILVLSLGMAKNNPEAANAYSEDSILGGGNYEPLMLKYAVGISNSFLGTDIGLSDAVTSMYLFNPITLAALAGIYISGLSLLPLSFLNGGQIVRSKYGKLAHLIATYLVIIATIYYNFLFSFLLLLVHQRLGVPDILNEESKISIFSNILVFMVLLIVILSVPLPINLLY
ncbi:MAG: hypothetical protein GPJ54_11400 [Candidatus Heimdallarchaeota archaeon]|nr:hypothetical protein [Candidatus Heimdallarchaeota archaeon]